MALWEVGLSSKRGVFDTTSPSLLTVRSPTGNSCSDRTPRSPTRTAPSPLRTSAKPTAHWFQCRSACAPGRPPLGGIGRLLDQADYLGPGVRHGDHHPKGGLPPSGASLCARWYPTPTYVLTSALCASVAAHVAVLGKMQLPAEVKSTDARKRFQFRCLGRPHPSVQAHLAWARKPHPPDARAFLIGNDSFAEPAREPSRVSAFRASARFAVVRR